MKSRLLSYAIAIIAIVLLPASCKKIKASDPFVSVRSVSLDESEVEITVGGSFVLTATIVPENATVKDITWSSNKSSVATVDDNGEVTGVAAGVAVITVTTKDWCRTASCKVVVKNEVVIDQFYGDSGKPGSSINEESVVGW